jgi:2-desacetyl-2-hydroxyethyl bacteriochlorophyllide A dehydrogenase
MRGGLRLSTTSKENKLMRTAVFAPNGPIIEDRPKPAPGPSDVLLRVEYCGICGSDLHAAEPDFHTGTTLGHEFVGTVEEVGSDVADFQPGDRVAVNPNGVVCGACEMCRTGQVNLCPAVWKHSVGVVRDGGLAAYATTDRRTLHRLPDGLSFRHAALVEPLAVALRAVRTSGFADGDSAVVFGGGPIGLLTTALLRAGGAARIAVVEPSAARREKAMVMGANRTVDPATTQVREEFVAQDRPRFAFDCSGVAEVVDDAVAVLAPGGTLTISGWSRRPPTFRAEDLVFKEVTIRGSFIYVKEFADALDLIATSTIDVEPLISGVVPVERVPEAFAAMSTSPEVTKFLVSEFHSSTA